jgi:DNA polymerase-4
VILPQSFRSFTEFFCGCSVKLATRNSQPATQKTMQRKIIHIDMDAFYTSVEQRDNPALRGKPVAVGGIKRGVVASASYEAREFGVRSAMPSSLALRKCPHLLFVGARFEVYREVSQQIREIFFEYTDLVEPLSLDEAYLDVTENKKGIVSAILIARQIRAKIEAKTRLTASAGVSVNKFVAKVASDINKPNGIKVILPEEVVPFLETLPIEKFHGIGKVTADKMKRLGIHNGKDLKTWAELDLVRMFGKAGRYFYKIVRGEDNREVNPNRIRKSIGAERTFNEDIFNVDLMFEKLKAIAENLFRSIEKSENYGRTLTIKIKFSDFQIITRSKTANRDIIRLQDMIAIIKELLYQNMENGVGVRLLGVSISNLRNEEESLPRQLEFDFY